MKTRVAVILAGLLVAPSLVFAGGAPSSATGGGSDVSVSNTLIGVQTTPFANGFRQTITKLEPIVGPPGGADQSGAAAELLTSIGVINDRRSQQRQNLINANTPGFTGTVSYGNIIAAYGG